MTSAPDAFLSCTRFDDQHDGGAISEFRLRLSSAVRAVTGQPFEIFQDIDGIGLGEKWSDKLDEILDQVRFFMPILTPSYFTSAACRDELKKFLRAEAARGRSDLVLPIYYITCDVLEDPGLCSADPLASALHERQRQDWRDLRFEPFTSPRVRRALEGLAHEIVRARRRAVPPAPSATSRTQLAYPTDEARSEPGTIIRDIDAPWCPELVVIPPGRFLMGSAADEDPHGGYEVPQHEVTIAQPFAAGRYPVTFDEYDRFAYATDRPPPHDSMWGRGRRPVINVSWHEAKAYVEWLCEQTGGLYRLLTEAEWEYACRAGTTTRYWWGDGITHKDANFRDSKIFRTTEVGGYSPNPWGLYDLHGNVWEWVEDCWIKGYDFAPRDGSARSADDRRGRILRGGAWSNNASDLRSAERGFATAESENNLKGFRLAKTLR